MRTRGERTPLEDTAFRENPDAVENAPGPRPLHDDEDSLGRRAGEAEMTTPTVARNATRLTILSSYGRRSTT